MKNHRNLKLNMKPPKPRNDCFEFSWKFFKSFCLAITRHWSKRYTILGVKDLVPTMKLNETPPEIPCKTSVRKRRPKLNLYFL